MEPISLSFPSFSLNYPTRILTATGGFSPRPPYPQQAHFVLPGMLTVTLFFMPGALHILTLAPHILEARNRCLFQSFPWELFSLRTGLSWRKGTLAPGRAVLGTYHMPEPALSSSLGSWRLRMILPIVQMGKRAPLKGSVGPSQTGGHGARALPRERRERRARLARPLATTVLPRRRSCPSSHWQRS